MNPFRPIIRILVGLFPLVLILLSLLLASCDWIENNITGVPAVKQERAEGIPATIRLKTCFVMDSLYAAMFGYPACPDSTKGRP